MGDVRLECKTTSGIRYTLKKADLEKIKREGQEALEEWAFVIQFQKQSGMGKKFVVCDYLTFRGCWAQQATEEDHLHIAFIETSAKQITLLLTDLVSEVGIAERKGAALLVELSFDGESSLHPYALTTWETYQALKESSNA